MAESDPLKAMLNFKTNIHVHTHYQPQGSINAQKHLKLNQYHV